MCRNIRVLHHFEPPTTRDEMRDAALQYVRKVGGITKLSAADTAAFERAVAEIAASTETFLGALRAQGTPRTRDGERAKAKVRWQRREASMRR